MQKQKKHILIFSMTFYPKPVGGAEVAIKEITDRMPADQFEFHLISLRLDSAVPKEEVFHNINVHRIGFSKKGADASDFKRFPLHLNKLLYQFSAVYHAWRLHRRHRFDAVWGMMAHSTGVPSALFTFFFPKVKYILTLQEGDPPEHIESKMRFFGPLFTRAFTSADRIQTISTFLGDWVKRRGSKEEPVIIPNGINASALTDVSQESVAALREELGKKEGETWLIHTGRYVHKNGLDLVIQALSLLPKDVHAFFIGDGPDREKLRSLAAAYGVSARTHFHPHVDSKELPVYLKACDIFIRPSRSEGMGISFIEAMAVGLPVVATQEGGISDFLFDEERNPEKEPTGWAVDTESAESIQDAVTTIRSDTERTERTVKHAQNMVLESYDWEHIAARMRREVFEPVLSETG